MPIIRQVAQLGHEVLRLKATKIEKITQPSIQSLIDDMLITVSDTDGVGIAAPQVYESLQIFVIASCPNSRYPNAPNIEPTAIINPEILWVSEEQNKAWEGCLSVPTIRGLVPRYKSIRAKYTTRDNTSKELVFSDFIARIFQHEYDHLNGISFLDRLDSTKDIMTEREFNRLIDKAT